jgi:dephospho-CoA kinase
MIASAHVALPVIGLTGGIASGKTTVANLLASFGAAIIDADVVAREVVQPGAPAYEAIVKDFGPGVVLPNGHLDRAALGARVFNDAAARLRLNQYTHPKVRQTMNAALAQIQQVEHKPPAVVMVIPLLFENGLQDAFTETWLVDAPESLQIERLQRRDGLNADDARARIASQMPIAQKRQWATHSIVNAGDEQSLEAAVRHRWRESVLRKPA